MSEGRSSAPQFEQYMGENLTFQDGWCNRPLDYHIARLVDQRAQRLPIAKNGWRAALPPPGLRRCPRAVFHAKVD
ncbi:MAG: hypothetical protein Kow0032_10620 [Methyloligellaceae bacterium]